MNFFKKERDVFSANADIDRLYDSLFYEPFYQLMRLQLLVQEMEDHKEMDADKVSVLYVSPKANHGFRNNVTSDYLRKRFSGQDVLEIWRELVPLDKFMSISAENLLNTIRDAGMAEREWLDYLETRYGWSSQIE